ncbi:hypothetical protein FJ987_29235 [Mesorhizobium sp. CU2]|uniref:hypothetical protein n=1 Tax=unclassified Mesorhizobium TaxID=325217 RepID=UPI00112DBAD6|nr:MULTISPECIES: hypothetical protein [unclassified Mesorhizobium]TPN76738.1 hypothetical protein FJ988_27715 [Mesorhizobium sp. CU3]TPO02090.1 hypothetical protein FJ987_29235 [Mesorhizobium sp. CU2]
MRNIILASVIATVSAAALATPSDAGNVFLGGSYFDYGPFGDFYDSYGSVPVYGSYWGGPYLNDAPGKHDDYDSSYVAPPNAIHARRHCRIEAVKPRSSDHRFMRQVRVCG